MIKGLALTNFKSIGKTLIANDEEITEGKLDFAPLTIFCGKNSSGKSTVLQSILLLAQTLQNNVPSQTFVLNGPMVKLGGVNDIKSEFLTSKDISIDIDFFNPKPYKGASASLKFRKEYSTINKTGCMEEEIFLEEIKKHFTYSLSNDLNQIIFTINSKTLFNINLEDIEWKLNTGLSKNVKDLMDKHQVNYSMTTYSEKDGHCLVINKRADNEWYYFHFEKTAFYILSNHKIIKKNDKKDNINISNQNINFSISFFNKKINDISNIIPIINRIHFKDEYIINNVPYSVDFSASYTNSRKYRNIITQDIVVERFIFNLDNVTKKLIGNKKLIGLKLYHFLPKKFVRILKSEYILRNFIISLRKYLKKEYQFDNQSVNNYNSFINYIYFSYDKLINITNILIPENVEINNKQLFKQYVSKSITELNKIKNELFNKIISSLYNDIAFDNLRLNPELNKNYPLSYTDNLPPHISDTINNITDFFQDNLIYIGPLREEPHLQYDGYIANTTNIGIKGENFAGALYQNKNRIVKYINPQYFEQKCQKIESGNCVLLDSVKEWLRYIGVASDIIVNFNGRYGYELKIKSFGKNKLNDLTNVGVGVSQVLPIVLTCLLAPEESTIIIEQPELHLHPAMQSRLTDFFVSTILCNKQIIIETHSEYIINRLRLRAINWPTEKPINDSVKIYFTENLEEDYKDYKKGNTIFKPLKINEYAAMSEWPEGFFDESSKIADEIIKASSKKWEEDRNDKK